jgi:hypothetical protein
MVVQGTIPQMHIQLQQSIKETYCFTKLFFIRLIEQESSKMTPNKENVKTYIDLANTG